jgi:Flp pilus assembly secretin CpaC
MRRAAILPAAMVGAIVALLAAPTVLRAADAVTTPGYSGPQSDSMPTGLGPGPAATVSSESTSRFIGLVMNKAVAVDLPGDAADVLVANPRIANAVLRTKRRVYLVGMGLGQTSIYFYDDKGRQIEGFDVNVADHTIAPRKPEKEILVVRGAQENEKQIQVYQCAPVCALSEQATATVLHPTINVRQNGSGSGFGFGFGGF